MGQGKKETRYRLVFGEHVNTAMRQNTLYELEDMGAEWNSDADGSHVLVVSKHDKGDYVSRFLRDEEKAGRLKFTVAD